ncbi:hypothetical protein AB0E01_42460 [Nocardia vinacea]|uniref:hypothetical protein n=1 Tax=Nocardia vinacea TaxID=96468 RepID=UPI0033CA25A3
MKPRDQRLVNNEGQGSANTVQLLRADDGEQYVFKPSDGEELGLRNDIPWRRGEYAKREVAAYRVDHLLGFGLVPPTTFAAGPQGIGEGSIQKFVHSSPGDLPHKYPEAQQVRLAVLDHIIGNTDRKHEGNWRTVEDTLSSSEERKRLLAIDHGLAFHEEMPCDSYGDFHQLHAGKPIPEDVMDSLRALDQTRLRTALRKAELSVEAIELTVYRLNQLLDLGQIPHPEIS